jgi:hypothetical protein
MSQAEEVAMSRILEGIFVIGCSLVGFGMSAPEGSGIKDTMQWSIQLIALAQNNMSFNAARLTANLAQVPVQILGALRSE